MSGKGFLFIIIGAIFECIWVFGLKYAQSSIEWAVSIGAMILSFTFLTRSLKHSDLSLAYVVFTGLGTLFVVLSEMAYQMSSGGTISLLRIFFIITLTIGVMGIKGAKS